MRCVNLQGTFTAGTNAEGLCGELFYPIDFIFLFVE